jgi:hypothetical protein
MSHVRQQIRDQLKTTLTGLSTTGANVFDSRVYDHDALPSLTIYTLSEELGEESANKQLRLLSIVVEARAKATTNLDNTLDTIGAEVEAAIFASGDTTLNGKCKDIDFEGIDIELSGDSDQPVGLMSMRFACLYRVNKSDVTTLIS